MSGEAYDDLFRDIGEICARWTYIEHLTHDLCLHGAWVVDPNISGGRKAWDLMHIALLNQAKIKDMTATARAILFMALTAEEYDAAHKALGEVERCGEKRNRFIHDMWSIEPEGLKLSRHRTRVLSKPYRLDVGSEDRQQPKEFILELEALRERLVDLDSRLAELAVDPS